MKSGENDSGIRPPGSKVGLFFRLRGTGGGGRFFKFITKFARYIKLENDVNQKGGILWLE
ncbi:hypothetical protein ABE47_00565 [Bacillus thuringiensis]|nr:hypothetical protein [Bacillus thuringiensis]MBG9492875.1 hypothetical protein [Bacillus thuringiensis]MBG9502195.1 hypothetical protein [Bacillus thuringiensis]MBG9507773.1 hypothetical protein [Bacillus thuringiensis]MBG9510747.1 hypothetical protein [Bacillus thuringiensis]